MSDESEGPYKLVSRASYNPEQTIFSIAIESLGNLNGRYLKVIIPDAGEGQNARHVCNLLNKDWRYRMKQREAIKMKAAEHDEA